MATSMVTKPLNSIYTRRPSWLYSTSYCNIRSKVGIWGGVRPQKNCDISRICAISSRFIQKRPRSLVSKIGDSWGKNLSHASAIRILSWNAPNRYFRESKFCIFLAISQRHHLSGAYHYLLSMISLKVIIFCRFWGIECVCRINVNRIFTGLQNPHS